jgi:uncharacterized protein (DUF488 family)
MDFGKRSFGPARIAVAQGDLAEGLGGKMTRKPRIFTLGHSDLSRAAFFRLLEGSSIRLVADVRSNPASARFPHFERNALARSLTDRGLSYRWFRALGGRAPESSFAREHTALVEPSLKRYAALMNTSAFKSVVEELVGLSASTVAAVLCAEKHVERCHRLLLSDRLHVMGVRVVHIVDSDTAFPHTLHPELSVEDDHFVYRARQLDLLS